MASGQSKGSLKMDGIPLHAIIWITFLMELDTRVVLQKLYPILCENNGLFLPTPIPKEKKFFNLEIL